VLPGRPDSAGWLANVAGFQRRYGIQIELSRATGDADQVAAARELDVLDLSPDIAQANTALFAPYLVFYWLQVPGALKHPKAYWYDDCGAFASIGYDPTRVPKVTSVQQLLAPDYRGSVSVAADPRTDEGALVEVEMAAVAAGGAPDDVTAGVEFFARLHASGNYVQWGASGLPPVLLNWDFAQPEAAHFVPAEASVEAYRAQAVSRFAPHPAAARLWEEYLLSDTGQNACLMLGGRPARMDAMRSEGTLDVAAADALEPVGPPVYVLSPSQLAAARAYVVDHWAGATGS
jgi:putative spermidine/putrescine transport system substrate-binding protein